MISDDTIVVDQFQEETSSESMEERMTGTNGKKPRAKRTSFRTHKLSDQDWFQIFKRVDDGETIKALAQEYGFGVSTYNPKRNKLGEAYAIWLIDGKIAEEEISKPPRKAKKLEDVPPVRLHKLTQEYKRINRLIAGKVKDAQEFREEVKKLEMEVAELETQKDSIGRELAEYIASLGDIKRIVT